MKSVFDLKTRKFREAKKHEKGMAVEMPSFELPEGYPYEERTTYAQDVNDEMSIDTEDGSFYASGIFGKTELPENVTSLVGAKVSATINGVKFEGELKEVTYYHAYWMSERTSVAAGNLHLLDNKAENLVDTGEDYCISVNVGEHWPYDHAVAFTLYVRDRGDVTVENLSCYSETVVPMAEKFLPPGIGGDESYYYTFDITTTEDGATEETIYTVDNVEKYDKSFLESLNAYIQSCFDKGTMPKFIMNVDGDTRYSCVGAYTAASEYGIRNNIFFGQNLKLFLIWSHDEENGEDLSVYVMSF